jgi:hypothetical protein
METLLGIHQRPKRNHACDNHLADTSTCCRAEANQLSVQQTATLPSTFGHFPNRMHGGKVRCIVCRLEGRKGMTPKLGEAGVRTNVSICNKCGATAHSFTPVRGNRSIHKLPKFANITCFQILHSPIGLELWQRSPWIENVASSLQRAPCKNMASLLRKGGGTQGKFKWR